MITFVIKPYLVGPPFNYASLTKVERSDEERVKMKIESSVQPRGLVVIRLVPTLDTPTERSPSAGNLNEQKIQGIWNDHKELFFEIIFPLFGSTDSSVRTKLPLPA